MPTFPPEFTDPEYPSRRRAQEKAELDDQIRRSKDHYDYSTRKIERLESEGKTGQAAVERFFRWWGPPVV